MESNAKFRKEALRRLRTVNDLQRLMVVIVDGTGEQEKMNSVEQLDTLAAYCRLNAHALSTLADYFEDRGNLLVKGERP